MFANIDWLGDKLNKFTKSQSEDLVRDKPSIANCT